MPSQTGVLSVESRPHFPYTEFDRWADMYCDEFDIDIVPESCTLIGSKPSFASRLVVVTRQLQFETLCQYLGNPRCHPEWEPNEVRNASRRPTNHYVYAIWVETSITNHGRSALDLTKGQVHTTSLDEFLCLLAMEKFGAEPSIGFSPDSGVICGPSTVRGGDVIHVHKTPQGDMNIFGIKPKAKNQKLGSIRVAV